MLFWWIVYQAKSIWFLSVERPENEPDTSSNIANIDRAVKYLLDTFDSRFQEHVVFLEENSQL